MRVVVVSRWYPSENEPLAGTFVEDQVRALRDGCDVQVLVPAPAPLRKVLRFLLARGPLEPVQRVPVPGTQLGLPIRWLVFERALRRLDPSPETVVHAHLLLPDGLALLLAARRHRRPFVVSEHVNFLDQLLVSRRALVQAKLVLRFAAAVLPVSDALVRQLATLEPRARLRKIGNPIDTARYAPAASPARSYALNVAIHLGEAKGTDVLLRAWAAARAHGELPELVIVGNGSDRAAMEALARELGLEQACRFAGLRSRDELLPMLRDAAFLVSASRSENVAGVVTEAIACGTPVISTRTGEPAGYVRENVGLLVEPGDVEGLARAAATMARTHGEYDPGQLHQLMVQLYGVETIRGQLFELYRELLGLPREREVVGDVP